MQIEIGGGALEMDMEDNQVDSLNVDEENAMNGWKKGPLPEGTVGWGGVVPRSYKGTGFWFADFYGDHVHVFPGDKILESGEVAWYNNSITQPPRPQSYSGSMLRGRIDEEYK